MKNLNNLVVADDFILKNLGLILKNKPKYYEGLQSFKFKKNVKDYGFKNTPYFWKKGDKLIAHMHMSTGEFVLISLLHFINERINYNYKKNLQNELTFILLDEVELALHPLAQMRLISFLKEISRDNNFCIYFATHSVEIISEQKPESLLLLEELDQKIRLTYPCYPAYATRDMYISNGCDFVILVEDTLAQKLVDKTVKNLKLKYRLIRTISCGGWEKVIDLQKEFKKTGVLGKNCNTVSILDRDIKDKYEKKYSDDKSQNNFKRLFLPILSVEKYLKMNLVDNLNEDFYDLVNTSLFNVRGLKDIISDYKTNYSKDDSKQFFKMLKSCYQDDNQKIDEFEISLIDLITEFHDVSSFENSLRRVLT